MYNLSKRLVASLKSRVYNSLSSDEPTSTAPSNPDMRTPAVGRKRTRDGENTPTLSFASPAATAPKINYASTVSSPADQGKRLKRVRIAEENGIHDTTHVAALDSERFQIAEVSSTLSQGGGMNSSLLLDLIPQDVLQTNICSFLTDARDYYALQMTCRKFHEVSDEAAILREVELSGKAVTGKGCILFEVHVPSIAVKKLYKFAKAGNQQAMYM
jgi:hypothetical protein